MRASSCPSRTPFAHSRKFYPVHMIPFPSLPSTWCVSETELSIFMANLVLQTGTIEDVKAKAEKLAKEMGN